MTDKDWARREAQLAAADATEYERLIREFGRRPEWVEAMRSCREVSLRLRRLAGLPH